jgi:hypothetical protein
VTCRSGHGDLSCGRSAAHIVVKAICVLTVVVGGTPAMAQSIGERLFITKGCMGCHGVSGRGGVGPDLAGTALSVAAFEEQLRHPRDKMPAFPVEAVTDEEAESIHDYLQGVGPPAARLAEEPPHGGLDPESCIPCHQRLEPTIVRQFLASAMGKAGAQNARVDFPIKQITCANCHGADHDVIMKTKGRVPETTCAACHNQIYQEAVLDAGHSYGPGPGNLGINWSRNIDVPHYKEMPRKVMERQRDRYSEGHGELPSSVEWIEISAPRLRCAISGTGLRPEDGSVEPRRMVYNPRTAPSCPTRGGTAPRHRTQKETAMRRLSILGILALAVTIAAPAHAGWVIKDADGSEAFISNGRMKGEWENGIMILNAEGETMTMVDTQKKVYAVGNIDEICTQMKNMVEEMMSGLPPEQRDMVQQMMAKKQTPEVTFVDKGPGGKVSGFDTKHYEVHADGELYEEVWLADDKALVTECKPVMLMLSKFGQCMASVNPMAGANSPEASPEYAKLYDMGMVVQAHSAGESNTPQITSVEKFDVPESTFDIPKDCKQVSFMDMFGMNQ